MKTLRYILLPVLMLLLVSCQQELLPSAPGKGEGDGKKVKVTFGVSGDFEEYDSWSLNKMDTKAFGEMTTAKRNSLKLRVYVFDQYGFFLEKSDALVANPQPSQIDPGNLNVASDETVFAVELTQSMNARRIHFVAVGAADYDTAVTQAYSYGSEGTFMKGISVTGDVDAYWARETVSQITEGTHFYRVPLLRNFAKFTVSPGTTLTNFTLKQFTVVNVPKSGCVAPFNTATGGFASFYNRTGSLTDPTATHAMKAYADLHDNQHFNGYMPLNVEWGKLPPAANATGDGGLTFVDVADQGNPNPLFMYESPNAEGEWKGNTYIIIKGRFTKPGQAQDHDTYYKVDIMFKDTEGYDENISSGISTYYNILRNFHYQISIDGVSFKGYDSAAEAASKPATNNISASILAEGVNNVSDGQGKRRLFVNEIYLMYNENGAKNNLQAKAITINDELQNQNIRIRVMSDPDNIISTSPAPAVVSGTTLAEDFCPVTFTLSGLDPAKPKTAVLRLYISELEGSETLFRDVTIVLRKKYDLIVDCTDVVPKSSGSAVKAELLIPDGINKNLFPLTFTLEPEKKTISPDVNVSDNQLPVNVGKSIVPGHTDESSFQFVKHLEYNVYSAANVKVVDGNRYRVIPCSFKTNTSESTTKIYATNEYFNTAYDDFDNGNPVFQDGDLARASIQPSDYYGAGNSYNYVVFKTVRATGNVTVSLKEGSQAAVSQSYNLATGTYRSGPVGGVYTYRIPFLTTTFDGSSYEATVSYSDTDFSETISGTAIQERRYLFIPLGSFETNMGTGYYAAEERFKSGILYGPVETTDPVNTGRVKFNAHGTMEIGNRVTPEFDGYEGFTFANGSGYHIGIYRSVQGGYFSSLSRNYSIRFYHSTGGAGNAPEDGLHTWRDDWYAEVNIGELVDRHAVDFQRDAANQAHTAAGLDLWTITFHAPTP